VIIDYEAKTITFHQSWLNDYYLCPERTRRALLAPDENVGSDATALGTAMHSYAEHRLGDEPIEVAMAAAFNALDHEFSLAHKNVQKSDAQVYDFLPAMCAAFEADILPTIPRGGKIEQKFSVLLGEWNDWQIILEGTIDYVTPGGIIYDWKTAGSPYKKWEKERWGIQPTAYAIGAVTTGLATYPVEWKYAIVIKKPESRPATQLVEFTRTNQHALWLREQIYSILAQHFDPGDDEQPGDGRGLVTDGPWPKNDQHALCSEKWCPFWSTCKGKYL